MNARKCIINVSLVVISIASLLANKSVKAESIIQNESTIYSACTNPGLFSSNIPVNQEEYKSIYLGYCTHFNSAGYGVSVENKKKRNKSTNLPGIISTSIPPTSKPNNTPTPKVIIISTPKPVSTDKPEEKECKNKNQYKEGTSDCNAGKGNG